MRSTFHNAVKSNRLYEFLVGFYCETSAEGADFNVVMVEMTSGIVTESFIYFSIRESSKITKQTFWNRKAKMDYKWGLVKNVQNTSCTDVL